MLDDPTEVVTETEVVETQPPSEPVLESPANPSPSTDNLRLEFDSLTRQTLSDQAATIQRLQNDLARKNETPVAPAKDDPSTFLEAPRTAIRDEVRAEVQAAVKPLIDFTQQMARESSYRQLIGRLQSGAPALYTAYTTNQHYVDQLMAGQDATPQNLQAAILMAQGASSLGLGGGGAAPVQPLTTTPARTVTPPHIPPSPPPAPRKVTPEAEIDQKIAAMTETERRAAKLSGFTDLKQYIAFRDAGTDAASWGDIK
jgi:hypothetical protein